MRAYLLPTAELLSRSHSRCGINRIKVLQLAIDACARRKLYVHVISMLRWFLKSYSVKTLTQSNLSQLQKCKQELRMRYQSEGASLTSPSLSLSKDRRLPLTCIPIACLLYL